MEPSEYQALMARLDAIERRLAALERDQCLRADELRRSQRYKHTDQPPNYR